MNEGTYGVEGFTYVDPHPPGFHPLGTKSKVVTELAEQLVVIPFDLHPSSGGGTGGEGTNIWVDESATEGFSEVPGSRSLFGANLAIRGAASGNFDDDGAREWVAVGISNSGSRVNVYTADRNSDGTVHVETVLSFDPGGFAAKDASVQVGDIDGDFRDEIIVVARSNFNGNPAAEAVVRVFDDPESGASEMMNMYRSGRHIGIWGWPIDVDGDGRDEVVVSLAGDTTDDGYHAVRLYDLPAIPVGAKSMVRVHNWRYLSKNPGRFVGSKSVVGDFDGDGKDEIALGKPTTFGGQMWVQIHGWDASGAIVSSSEKKLAAYIDDPGEHFWSMAAFDRRAGHAEFAVFAPHDVAVGRSWKLSLLDYDGSWDETELPLGAKDQGYLPGLSAGDINGDGTEELQWALQRASNSSATLLRGYLNNDPSIGLQNLPTRSYSGNSMRSRNPVVVCGDWDADGLEVEYTGRTFMQMARPIPLAVLSAPPTRAGISQNYDDTSTRYETGTSSTQTWGVISGTTLTAAIGAEFDVFGLFKVGGRATIEEALSTTQTETSQVSYVSGYTGSYETDTIVFQGTLNLSYEYRILSAPDPTALGRYITLNVPVQSQTYNWTVDYYNSLMAPKDQVPLEIRTHKPGKIGTYPTRDELDGMVAGSLHWQYPIKPNVGQDVGMGAGSNDLEIAFSKENTTATQRTVTVGGEGELGFGVTASVGAASESGSIYEIAYSDTSRFTTTVGKIKSPVEYQAWRYNWGLVVQTYGRTADANNVPTGYTSGSRPFQLVRYWADPVGSGYGK